jgi:arsenate reductase
MTNITIYHNAKCGTSRNTLSLIQEAGFEPNVVLYLENPPSKAELSRIIQASGESVRHFLRERGTPYQDLDLGNPKWSDEALIDFMIKHPILINRPIVVTDKGVRLCRPAEAVLDLLP